MINFYWMFFKLQVFWMHWEQFAFWKRQQKVIQTIQHIWWLESKWCTKRLDALFQAKWYAFGVWRLHVRSNLQCQRLNLWQHLEWMHWSQGWILNNGWSPSHVSQCQYGYLYPRLCLRRKRSKANQAPQLSKIDRQLIKHLQLRSGTKSCYRFEEHYQNISKIDLLHYAGLTGVHQELNSATW